MGRVAAQHYLDEEEEELNYPIARTLLAESDKIVETIVERINDARETVFKKLWEKLGKPKPLNEVEPVNGVAVDSTYPPEGGVELLGGLLVGIVAGYVVYKGSPPVKPVDFTVRVRLVETEEEKAKLPIWAKMLERKLVLRLLDWVEEGKLDIKMILIDGEIIPYKLVFGKPRTTILKKLDNITSKMIEKARRLETTIVGVVKRSYSRLLTAVTGKPTPLNDKAIMTLLLHPGEHITIGQYKDLIPGYMKALGKRNEGPARPEYGETIIAFYKPKHATQAVKAEILDYAGIGVDNVIGMLAKLTNPATGLPYPIDYVDELVRFEARLLELLRRRLAAKIAEQLGPTATILLAHTNPEKRYLYEPRKTKTTTNKP